MNDPLVSIVIATASRYKLLENALMSIKYQTFQNFEIILVCPKKDEKMRRIALRFAAKLFEDRGKGMCFARNLGSQKAKGEIIVFLDDDVVLDNNWIELIVKDFTLCNKVGGVGGIPIPVQNRVFRFKSLRQVINKMQGLYGWEGNRKFIRKVSYLSGCNMAFRRNVLRLTGGFDENFYGPSAGEDADFCFRVLSEGFSLLFDPRAVAHHDSDYITRTLYYHKDDLDHFLSIADNSIYWRLKNQLLVEIPQYCLYCFNSLLMALFWSFATQNPRVFFAYLKGVLIGYIRAKPFRTRPRD